MIITKQSVMSGIVRDREIDVTRNQLDKWKGGMLIQDAMPHLSADDREFIMTGITPEEWDGVFKEDTADEVEEPAGDTLQDDQTRQREWECRFLSG